ncbi:MAG: hypothetical protein U9Q03_04950 [Patescibacteria group bacterium]|nr:hypothetical protein [Patescibacteria group bacterium]
MSNHPNKPGKRVIRRKITPSKNVRKIDEKTRSEISGSFHFKARRDNMYADELELHEHGPKYMREGGQVVNFGGQVTAVGKFSRSEKQELLNLVENIGDLQRQRDACDRILRIKSTRSGFVVSTAKSHLAVAIGKKLHRARKGGELSITWSHHDLPVRVLWIADIE